MLDVSFLVSMFHFLGFNVSFLTLKDLFSKTSREKFQNLRSSDQTLVEEMRLKG